MPRKPNKTRVEPGAQLEIQDETKFIVVVEIPKQPKVTVKLTKESIILKF